MRPSRLGRGLYTLGEIMRFAGTRQFLIGTLCTLALACCAKADSIAILNLGNDGIPNPPYAGPYASLTVDLIDPTHATITFNSLTSGNFEYLIAGAQTAAVEVNATTFTVTPISSHAPNATFNAQPAGDPSATINGNDTSDGFGKFNLSIDSFDGFTSASDQISFTITDTSGTWSDPTTVLKQNGANGYIAAAHIFVTDITNGLNANTSPNPTTGYAATQGGFSVLPPSVPTPSAALGGLTLLGVLAFRRKLGLRR